MGALPAPLTFAQLDLQAAHRLDITVFDSLKAAHVVRVYFVHLDADNWRVYAVLDAGEIVGGTAGDVALLTEAGIPFNSNGDIVFPLPIFGDSISWASGARRSSFLITMQGLTQTAAATAVTYSVNGSGSATLCPQANAKDFDGDGADDVVLWNANRREWSIRLSGQSSAEVLSRRWGRRGDVPLTGDVTGDGKADIIYWRPGRLRWFVCSSESAFDCTQPTERSIIGARAGDVPILNDMDGDGVIDLGVYRAKGGLILHERSILQTQGETSFGARHFLPVPTMSAE